MGRSSSVPFLAYCTFLSIVPKSYNGTNKEWNSTSSRLFEPNQKIAAVGYPTYQNKTFAIDSKIIRLYLGLLEMCSS